MLNLDVPERKEVLEIARRIQKEKARERKASSASRDSAMEKIFEARREQMKQRLKRKKKDTK